MVKNPYSEKPFNTKVYGLKKGDKLTFTSEGNLYYDNKISGKRERFDGKSGKLTKIYSNQDKFEVTFEDGSKVESSRAFVNYTKTPEYKTKLN